MNRPFRLAVLISGSGSNLQALIDAQNQPGWPARVGVVVSNKADALGLERARRAGIATEVLDHRGYATRNDYDRDLRRLLEAYQPELVVLAGFMRILTPELVEPLEGRLINIHPSLLPAYRGLHTHQRAIAAGERRHGCSVHYVIPELDAGPVIVQAQVPVLDSDDADSLAERVQQQEHRIYPMAVRWIAQGRVRMRKRVVYRDGEPQREPPVIQAGDDLDRL